MQFWPRKKAKRSYARVRSWINPQKKGMVGFCGYKVGMAHIIATDDIPNSLTQKQTVSIPVTIIECPPIKIASVVFYKKSLDGDRIISEVFAEKFDKELGKKINVPKKPGKKLEEITGFDDIKVKIYTQPKLTGIGAKKPQIFEIALGGTKEDKLTFAKEHLGKEVKIQEVFSPGEQIDIHSVTKGKGNQGPMKRFGISLRNHKSEKSIRNPGSLGGWKSQGKVMFRVSHAGQTGYHLRTEYNKWVLKIGEDGKEVNPKGGFQNYGLVKGSYMILKGSIGGSRKRLITFAKAMRPNSKVPNKPLEITKVSTTENSNP